MGKCSYFGLYTLINHSFVTSRVSFDLRTLLGLNAMKLWAESITEEPVLPLSATVYTSLAVWQEGCCFFPERNPKCSMYQLSLAVRWHWARKWLMLAHCVHYNSYKSCWAVHGSSGVHVQFREAKKTFLLNVLFWTVKCKMFLFNFFYSYDVLISFYIFKLAQHFKLVLFYLVILIKHFKLFRFIRYMVIILTIKPGNNYLILLF